MLLCVVFSAKTPPRASLKHRTPWRVPGDFHQGDTWSLGSANVWVPGAKLGIAAPIPHPKCGSCPRGVLVLLGAPVQVPWGGWHSSAPLGSPCPSPGESWGWGCCIFLSSTGEKSPSFEPKQHQLRLEQSAGPSLPGARMGLGSGPCALGVLLAHLPSHLCAHFPFLDSSFTLGIFFAFTQHPQLLVLGVLRLMRDQCPRGRGCSETQNEIRQICVFIQGEIHLCFFHQTKTALKFFWHLGERLGAVSRGTLSSEAGEATQQRL